MLKVLGAVALFQMGLRVWVRLRPQPIPFGWSWLLENPWRRVYRDPQRTAGLCELRPSDRVLEVGCGSGLFTAALAAHCQHLIAADLNADYLAQTRLCTSGLTNIEYLHADALRLPLPDDCVDVVVFISALTEVPSPVRALQEALRVLRPGGRIVISEEMFAPEYVPVGVTDGWARAAGLSRMRFTGNAWVYFCQYQSAGEYRPVDTDQ
jgi:ubiquinone/menaquinone biosynthesis C-methylase UbiE